MRIISLIDQRLSAETHMSVGTTSTFFRSQQHRRGYCPVKYTTFRQKMKYKIEIRCHSDLNENNQPLGPDGLSPADLPTWIACREKLVNVGMSVEDAEKAMVRGFGWGSQAYWRQELVQESPSVEAIESVLEYLNDRIGLEKDSDKAEVIQKFPELLQVKQSLMEENVTKLEKNFFLKGKALAMSLKRKPRVLGATTDCEGDCAGDCTRCFAQF